MTRVPSHRRHIVAGKDGAPAAGQERRRTHRKLSQVSSPASTRKSAVSAHCNGHKWSAGAPMVAKVPTRTVGPLSP